MASQDLNELEQQIRTLQDPKDREEGLKAIAELRAMREVLLQLPATPTPSSPRPSTLPALRYPESRSGKFFKLLVGTLAFLALCFSLMSLVLPVGMLLDDNVTVPTYRLLLAAISACLASAVILGLAARRPREEREAIAQDPITRQFARQKAYLAFSIGGLIALSIAVIVVTKRAEWDVPLLAYGVTFGFFIGTWMLNRAFWRCPKCGTPLPSSQLRFDGACPHCHATLQYPTGRRDLSKPF